MPTELKAPATPEAIECLIHQWFDALAAGEFRQAFEMTLHDPWFKRTPQLLEREIGCYGSEPHPDEVPRYHVTDWRIALKEEREPYRTVEFFPDQRHGTAQDAVVVGQAFFDLPVDGRWSNLTAIFSILQKGDTIMLELIEIHVL